MLNQILQTSMGILDYPPHICAVSSVVRRSPVFLLSTFTRLARSQYVFLFLDGCFVVLTVLTAKGANHLSVMAIEYDVSDNHILKAVEVIHSRSKSLHIYTDAT